MNKRETAIAEGKVTYNSGKPCRKGHESDRYSSNGQCIECLRQQNEARQGTLRAAKIRRNTALFAGFQPMSVMVRACDRDLMQRYADVLQFGSRDQIAKCAEVIEQTYQRCPIPRALSRDDLLTFMDYLPNGSISQECLNRLHLSHPTDDDPTLYIYYNGFRYRADECMAVLRQQRFNVTPK